MLVESGEPAKIPTAAAIANAFLTNATGVRIRELPMRPAGSAGSAQAEQRECSMKSILNGLMPAASSRRWRR